MLKARKEIESNLKLIDIVVILLDARAPFSCRNPMLESMVRSKKTILVFNKIDLADPAVYEKQVHLLRSQKQVVVTMNSLSGEGKKQVLKAIETLFHPVVEAMQAKGRKRRAARIMVAGVPNTGKSTFLNNIVGKKTAVTGAKPGITKGKQWVRIRDDVEILDTPGVMWPKIENEEQGMKLALLNIVGENAYDPYYIALFLLSLLQKHYPSVLQERFREKNLDEPLEIIMQNIARQRGHLLPQAHLDVDKTANVLLQEFRQGKLGRISLDLTEQIFP